MQPEGKKRQNKQHLSSSVYKIMKIKFIGATSNM